MNSKLSPGEKNEMILEVEIAAEETELPLKQVCKKHSLKGAIPGFRKGKVPQQIVENFIGIENLLAEVVDELLPDYYKEIIEKNELYPISPPKIELGKLEKGKPILLTAKIPIKPQAVLGQYKGLTAVRKVKEYTEEDITAAMLEARTRVARLVEYPEGTAAENGHIANIDFAGFLDGKAFDGGSFDGYVLELGSGAFIPGFEEQLLGAKSGEERDVFVTFPETYGEKKLAGREVTFKVKINNLKFRDLPALDSEFVQDISETAETVEEWREEVRAKLRAKSLDAADEQTRFDLMAQAMANCEVDIPFFMAEPRIEQQYTELNNKLEEQGMELQDYLRYIGSDYLSLRKQFRVVAERDIKCDLMLEAIARAEGLKATEEEIEEEIKALADSNYQQVDEYKKTLEENGEYGGVEYRILLSKAAGVIFGTAIVTNEYEATPAAAAEEKTEEIEEVKEEVIEEAKEAAGEAGEAKKASKRKAKVKEALEEVIEEVKEIVEEVKAKKEAKKPKKEAKKGDQ
ncbi:MAG: trigger factor [Clostridiales bacterium]|nr:trigger factor [Clostridiales bacterium]